jgi:hypothetical protein
MCVYLSEKKHLNLNSEIVTNWKVFDFINYCNSNFIMIVIHFQVSTLPIFFPTKLQKVKSSLLKCKRGFKNIDLPHLEKHSLHVLQPKSSQGTNIIHSLSFSTWKIQLNLAWYIITLIKLKTPILEITSLLYGIGKMRKLTS